jgi:hypothetical protein
MVVVFPPLIFSLAITFSKKSNAFLSNVKQEYLIIIQSFRIIMELILWRLYVQQTIPVQMTFEGLNWDILAGITAIIMGFWVKKKMKLKSAVLIWNIFGLVLLMNIVVIAVLSTPLPLRQFMNEPANTMVAYFPFVWLPGFVVPVAYTFHFLSLKKAIGNY